MGVSWNSKKVRKYSFVIAVLLPIMLLFTVIRIIPISDTIITSLYRRNMIRPGKEYIGFENYSYIFKDPGFFNAMSNTAIIASVSMLASIAIGLFLAVEVNDSKLKGMKFWQAILFVPVIVSVVPSTLMWKMLFDYNIGIVNYVIKALGGTTVDWINNERNVTWVVIIVCVWKEMGYNMMIYYVGLKAIPHELYESAAIDGASRYQRLRYITLPMLKPSTLFLFVTGLIKFVKVFTQSTVMTSGSQSSGNILKTIVYYIYQQGFSFHSMGRASAAATVLLVIVLLLTLLQFRITRERE